jgi:hypothetical protein
MVRGVPLHACWWLGATGVGMVLSSTVYLMALSSLLLQVTAAV